MRGTKAILELRQGAAEQYKASLYIRAADGIPAADFSKTIEQIKLKFQQKYPGFDLIKKGNEYVVKPGTFKSMNAAEVAISYILDDKMPTWEVPNMIAKYYTTTGAIRNIKRD
jgi:hypothetical protein